MEINYLALIIDLIITLVAYLGYPFYKFVIKKGIDDLKMRKKIVLWNSIIVALLFTLIKLICFGYDDTTINFAPAFLYYIINRLLYIRKNDDKKDV